MASLEYILSGPDTLDFDTKEGLVPLMFNNLKTASNKIFHINIDTEDIITYEQLWHKTIRMASALQSLGIGFGKVGVLVGDNSLELFSVYFGSIFTGALPGCVNPTMTQDELRQLFNILQPDFVFCMSEFFEKTKFAVKNLQNNPIVIVPDGSAPYLNYNDLLTHDPDAFILPTLTSWDEHIIGIFFSSGTTGLPKGVKVKDKGFQFVMKSALSELSVRLTQFPICTGSSIILVFTIVKDLGTMLYGGKTNATIINALRKYKPSWWFGAPSNMLQLANEPDISPEDFSSIECMFSTGAGLTREQIIFLNKKLFNNRIGVVHVYNCSETLGVTSWPQGTDFINSPKIGSVGKVLPLVHLKVIHLENGETLGPGHEGEFYVKTPFLMDGYINCTKETAEVLGADGWYKTGDVGYYDEDGYVYISGRVKEIFKCKNRQVSPMQLEGIIQNHPAVHEAAVTGKPHHIDGYHPFAFVVLKKNGPMVDEDELIQFVNDQVADYRKLYGVHFVENIPKTASGKKMRGVLLKTILPQ